MFERTEQVVYNVDGLIDGRDLRLFPNLYATAQIYMPLQKCDCPCHRQHHLHDPTGRRESPLWSRNASPATRDLIILNSDTNAGSNFCGLRLRSLQSRRLVFPPRLLQ